VFSKMNVRQFCRISFEKNEDAVLTQLRPAAKIDNENKRGDRQPKPRSTISRLAASLGFKLAGCSSGTGELIRVNCLG